MDRFVQKQTPPSSTNVYLEDPALCSWIHTVFTAATEPIDATSNQINTQPDHITPYHLVHNDLVRFGHVCATEAESLSLECERSPPTLSRVSAWGDFHDRVWTCTAWQEQKMMLTREGTVSLPHVLRRQLVQTLKGVTASPPMHTNEVATLTYMSHDSPLTPALSASGRSSTNASLSATTTTATTTRADNRVVTGTHTHANPGKSSGNSNSATTGDVDMSSLALAPTPPTAPPYASPAALPVPLALARAWQAAKLLLWSARSGMVGCPAAMSDGHATLLQSLLDAEDADDAGATKSGTSQPSSHTHTSSSTNTASTSKANTTTTRNTSNISNRILAPQPSPCAQLARRSALEGLTHLAPAPTRTALQPIQLQPQARTGTGAGAGACAGGDANGDAVGAADVNASRACAWTSGQWMTEMAGGSDVSGATRTIALPGVWARVTGAASGAEVGVCAGVAVGISTGMGTAGGSALMQMAVWECLTAPNHDKAPALSGPATTSTTHVDTANALCPDASLLFGYKWFTSAVDSEVAATLAREVYAEAWDRAIVRAVARRRSHQTGGMAEDARGSDTRSQGRWTKGVEEVELVLMGGTRMWCMRGEEETWVRARDTCRPLVARVRADGTVVGNTSTGVGIGMGGSTGQHCTTQCSTSNAATVCGGHCRQRLEEYAATHGAALLSLSSACWAGEDAAVAREVPLTCYIVLIRRADGSGRLNGIRVEKLKEKLGTRQLPTAELALHGTVAFRLGAHERGIPVIASLLNVSRMHNALAAASYARAMLVRVELYAHLRSAFGRPLIGHRSHARAVAQWSILSSLGCVAALDLSAVVGAEETAKLLIKLGKSVNTGGNAVTGAASVYARECAAVQQLVECMSWTDTPLTISNAHTHTSALTLTPSAPIQHIAFVSSVARVLAPLARMLTPLVKLGTADDAAQCCLHGVELLGAVGYMEDSGAPLLLRDCLALGVWEGPGNVCVEDVKRAGKGKGKAHGGAEKAGHMAANTNVAGAAECTGACGAPLCALRACVRARVNIMCECTRALAAEAEALAAGMEPRPLVANGTTRVTNANTAHADSDAADSSTRGVFADGSYTKPLARHITAPTHTHTTTGPLQDAGAHAAAAVEGGGAAATVIRARALARVAEALAVIACTVQEGLRWSEAVLDSAGVRGCDAKPRHMFSDGCAEGDARAGCLALYRVWSAAAMGVLAAKALMRAGERVCASAVVVAEVQRSEESEENSVAVRLGAMGVDAGEQAWRTNGTHAAANASARVVLSLSGWLRGWQAPTMDAAMAVHSVRDGVGSDRRAHGGAGACSECNHARTGPGDGARVGANARIEMNKEGKCDSVDCMRRRYARASRREVYAWTRTLTCLAAHSRTNAHTHTRAHGSVLQGGTQTSAETSVAALAYSRNVRDMVWAKDADPRTTGTGPGVAGGTTPGAGKGSVHNAISREDEEIVLVSGPAWVHRARDVRDKERSLMRAML